MKKVLFTCALLLSAFNVYAQTVPLTINIEGVSSDKGNILVGICASAEEFAEREPCKYSFSMPAEKGSMTKQVNIDKGRYGIIVYYDENGNNILDMAMFGKPKEKYGFSNNKYGPYGSKPPFEDALVNVNGSTTVTIKLRK